MTVPGKGGSPRLPHVPTSLGVCPIHGEVEFRTHKVGRRRDGSQKFRRRCPDCHNARNNARKDDDA